MLHLIVVHEIRDTNSREITTKVIDENLFVILQASLKQKNQVTTKGNLAHCLRRFAYCSSQMLKSCYQPLRFLNLKCYKTEEEKSMSFGKFGILNRIIKILTKRLWGENGEKIAIFLIMKIKIV
jgi:hypothetical protein